MTRPIASAVAEWVYTLLSTDSVLAVSGLPFSSVANRVFPGLPEPGTSTPYIIFETPGDVPFSLPMHDRAVPVDGTIMVKVVGSGNDSTAISPIAGRLEELLDLADGETSDVLITSIYLSANFSYVDTVEGEVQERHMGANYSYRAERK